MAKIHLSDHQLVVDGKDISDAVAAGSPNLRFQPDGTARLNVDIVTTAYDIDVEGIVEVARATEPTEIRTVVLTKPGDTLLVGNVSRMVELTQDQMETATKLFGAIGLTVMFFEDDIDIAKLPADG